MSDFESEYRDKLTTPEAFARSIEAGDHIAFGIWYGEAYGAMAAVAEHCGDIDRFFVTQHYQTSPSDYLGLPGAHCLTSFFGPTERAAQQAHNKVFYIPNQFTDLPKMVQNNRPWDYFVYRVTPMDGRGMFNFSLTASWEYTAIRWIKENKLPTKVVFEVNKNLPRLYGLQEFGGNELSIEYADMIVEDDSPILDFPMPPPTPLEERIAAQVAALVEDKATIQLGFGTLPMAIGKLLVDRKELGIHTEMICEAHLDLVEAGSVTNEHKGVHNGRSVATFALGTKRLHDWMRENKDCAMLPVKYVNSPTVIASVNNMTAINSILAVDMTGQACAHCLMNKLYSGIGGALEFTYGAQMSPGGKSILCLPSTATLKDGSVVSNIMAQFPAGTRVTIPEYIVEWVVTEYGAARLKFMPVEQRAAALIEIAHPDFREDLARQIRDAGVRLDEAQNLPPLPAHYFSNVVS